MRRAIQQVTGKMYHLGPYRSAQKREQTERPRSKKWSSAQRNREFLLLKNKNSLTCLAGMLYDGLTQKKVRAQSADRKQK
jgi:hypothetical protein